VDFHNIRPLDPIRAPLAAAKFAGRGFESEHPRDELGRFVPLDSEPPKGDSEPSKGKYEMTDEDVRNAPPSKIGEGIKRTRSKEGSVVKFLRGLFGRGGGKSKAKSGPGGRAPKSWVDYKAEG
jgi:hypothetical protein